MTEGLSSDLFFVVRMIAGAALAALAAWIAVGPELVTGIRRLRARGHGMTAVAATAGSTPSEESRAA